MSVSNISVNATPVKGVTPNQNGAMRERNESVNSTIMEGNKKSEAVKAEIKIQSDRSKDIAEKSNTHLAELHTELEEAVRVLNESLARSLTSARISRDEMLNRYVVRITEKKSGEIIREIPSEDLLNFARHLEKIKGLLFDDVA